MTEESERDDVVYQHPLSWRSQGKKNLPIILTTTTQSDFKFLGLNKLIAKLDQRHQRKEKKSGTFVAKKRVRSVQSALSPPKNAPKWTLASDYSATSQPLSAISSGGSSHSGDHELLPGSEHSHTPTSPSSHPRYRNPRTMSLSRESQENTPHTATTNSRPRNLLNDIYNTSTSCTALDDDLGSSSES